MNLNLCLHHHAEIHSERWNHWSFQSHHDLRHDLLSPRTVAHPARGNTQLLGTSELYNIKRDKSQQIINDITANLIQINKNLMQAKESVHDPLIST